MAIIETPEVDQQLQVAEADLKSAQADLSLAEVTASRYQNLLKSDSVSQQETDVATSSAAAKRASVEAAEANVRRLQQLQSFERIYAPFSGIVTARNTDIGDLINAGTGDASTPNQHQDLFRIAATGKLRVFVPVPEVYVPDIHDGDTATLTLDEYPGQEFVGRITRNSNAIDMASRTLNVEVDVDNPQGKLLPGAYVFVHFKLPQAQQKLSVPANTILFRSEGLRVGVVRNGHVHLQPITIAKDNGATLEVASGLQSSDQIILDPPDSLAEGQAVRVNPKGVVVP
jgi:RND family efflux transporter MFP subunit